jgi:putative transposase
LRQLLGWFPRLLTIYADGGYAEQLCRAAMPGGWWSSPLDWAGGCCRSSNAAIDRAKGFVVLPKRWVVERTFAWLGRYRRLSKDYEEQTRNSETMIRLAMINLMVHRLKPG